MLKYTEAKVTFAEIPDHITLCINISNCPCKCKNCHSSYLAEDIGEELDRKAINDLILANKGISCICIMGGDSDPIYVNFIAYVIKTEYPVFKVAWYSGRQELAKEINLNYFDYIKLGPYLEECGPLNCRTTNQRFYKVAHTNIGTSKLYDITHKFYKNED